MKILTIVGARPHFIKAAVVLREMRWCDNISEFIIHTGQYYDRKMSGSFFEELDIAKPFVNLGVGSGSHGSQTAKMLVGIEECLVKQKPDVVVVYGDTNSTLAGALAGSKLNIPIAHVEAGLRSFNKSMPEEINRITTDHLSSFLFSPSLVGKENLLKEGLEKGVVVCGDVMQDAVEFYSHKAKELDHSCFTDCSYILATIHRAENTSSKERLQNIFDALTEIVKFKNKKVILPLHPRTRKMVDDYGISLEALTIVEPVSYLEMLSLAQGASMIMTDSGGLQKEAFWLGTPCLTLRDETEWLETVDQGRNKLVGASKDLILTSFSSGFSKDYDSQVYGNGNAAPRILDVLADSF